jgi:hypothetical protein
MKKEVSPFVLIIAVVGLLALLGVGYKVFIANGGGSGSDGKMVTKEEEARYKGTASANYAETYKKQHSAGAPGAAGGYGRGGGGYGGGYGGYGGR